MSLECSSYGVLWSAQVVERSSYGAWEQQSKVRTTQSSLFSPPPLALAPMRHEDNIIELSSLCFLLLGRRQWQLLLLPFFFLSVLLRKRKQQQSIAFSYFSLIFLLFIYGYFVAKKVTVAVIAIAFLFFFSLFDKKKIFFFNPFVTKKVNSLKLTINNDFVIFLNV